MRKVRTNAQYYSFTTATTVSTSSMWFFKHDRHELTLTPPAHIQQNAVTMKTTERIAKLCDLPAILLLLLLLLLFDDNLIDSGKISSMIYGAELEAYYAERLVNRKLLDNLIDSGKISSMIYGAESLKAYYAERLVNRKLHAAGWLASCNCNKGKGFSTKDIFCAGIYY